MVAQTSLNVRPVSTPHLDNDHLALADRYFQIKDTATPSHLLKIHCWSKGRFLNHVDDIHLWESNFPRYTFPEFHPFPDIVHFCHACYIPSQSAIVAPNHELLFTMTPESINQMLQIQPIPNQTPLSITNLLDLYITLDLVKIKQIFKNFIIEEHHTPTDILPYAATIFSKTGRRIIIVLSCILGYTSDEHVDEVIMAFLSIFTPGKPPAIMYDYDQFIADRMHEQFTKLPTWRVFKYSSVLFYMFLYYQTNKFPMRIHKLDTKGEERSVIYWTPLVQKFSTAFTYKDFIDSFVYPVMNMLTSKTQPRISQRSREYYNWPKTARWKIGTCTKTTLRSEFMAVS